MALRHATPGEVVDLQPLGSQLATARTAALIKAEHFEAVRLIVRAGTEIARHQVPGPITLHCLEGRVRLGLEGSERELAAGQWLYLEGGAPHSVIGIEDSALLLTILFTDATTGDGKAGNGAGREPSQHVDSQLDEALMETFPASDPVALSNPSTGIGGDRRSG